MDPTLKDAVAFLHRNRFLNGPFGEWTLHENWGLAPIFCKKEVPVPIFSWSARGADPTSKKSRIG